MPFFFHKQKEFLETSITLDEVKNPVWRCGGDKSPRLDGLTFRLIKDKCDIMKGDIFNFVKDFEKYGSLARGAI